MKIELLGQFGQNCSVESVGNAIESTIINEHTKYEGVRIYSAFATRSRVSKLAKLLSQYEKLNSSFYIGVDQGGTSEEALEALLQSGFSTSIIYTPSKMIFHPKIYIFDGNSECKVILGSSNLTDSGFLKNIEANISIELNLSNLDDLAFYEELNTALSSLNDNEEALTEDLIKLLVDSGIVPTEAATRKTYSKSSSSSQIDLLKSSFPNITRTVSTEKSNNITKKTNDSNTKVILPNNKKTTQPSKFWFETGKSTGGSRNILDISISSYKGEIPGAVSLFGLVASEVRHEYTNKALLKRISIDYEGITFTGNDIVFPVSKVTGHTNGTPRLQLRGIAKSGTKFTSELNKDGIKGFVDKVCLFTYIDEDHYKMELLDYSSHINETRLNSLKVDKAKSTAKEFGILKM